MYTQIQIPKFHVNETKATITEIRVREKDFVKKNDVLLLVEDTKAVNEITAPVSGYVLLICREFDEKNVGDVVGVIFDSMEELEAYHDNGVETPSSEEPHLDVNATKKAVALAIELGVDLEMVSKAYPEEVIKEKTVQKYFDTTVGHKASSDPYGNVFKYDRERVVIIGAGRGAEVVTDILLDDYDKVIVGLVDDNVKEFEPYGFPVFDCGVFEFPDKIDRGGYDTVIASMGSNLKLLEFRDKIFKEYSCKGIEFTNAIAKSVEIRRGVKIGKGNIIGGGCYIGTLAQIGNNNPISHCVSIAHHNLIGDCNLFGPGVFTSGFDTIGSGCIIPSGVSMINGVVIGDNVILPVGYSVVNSIPSGSVIKQRTMV